MLSVESGYNRTILQSLTDFVSELEKCTICVLCVRQCIQVFFNTYIEIVLNKVSQYQYEKLDVKHEILLTALKI